MTLRIKLLLTALMLGMLVLFSTCKKDESDPSILGTWILNIGTDENIPVQLSFFANDFFEWIPLVPTDNHTRTAAEYTYSGGVLTITNDPDCPEDGIYEITVKDDALTIDLVEDGCEPRIAGLVGTWSRKNDMPERRIQSFWVRNVQLEGSQREIVFYPQQNGVFEWLISEPTSVYESTGGRYAIGENYLVLFNFLDCPPGLGYYTYLFEGESALTITPAAEFCDIRSDIMAGTWISFE